MEEGIVHDAIEFLRRLQPVASTWLQLHVKPKLLVRSCAINLPANRFDVTDQVERPAERSAGITIGQRRSQKCVAHCIERCP
jgi:hypothetical protein